MTLADVALDDRYALQEGRVLMSGTHALVRLPMLQHARDKAAGLNTGAYVTGYRGSPLGAIDMALWQAGRFADDAGIRFNPGVNEDLAATAVWGTQQTHLFDDATVDGVFAMFYAKGPGIDRSGDALKHGNTAGTSPHGGVLVLAGDDHTCKSSTSAHQSEFALVDAMIPILHPAGVQEFLDLGLHGWAMSRFTGLWTGFKLVSETVDTTATVAIDPARVRIVLPSDAALPPEGVHLRLPDDALAKEERLHRYKLDLATAYVRANRLDQRVFGKADARLGIVTTGKSYLDVRQALDEIGLTPGLAEELGVALYKIAMPWPLEPEGIADFASGLDEILVVEEKRALIEPQIRDQLYHLADGKRPLVIGKKDEAGATILPSWDELSPAMIGDVIARRLARFGIGGELAERAARLKQKLSAEKGDAAPISRIPYFCSGCPHSSSTRVPDGSQAFAGIGCHYLVQSMDRDTLTFTQMGAEGANWNGLFPFREADHVFVNIGDGTYVHSGSLAIRAAVSAGVNVTYKILYNDAVAMTGGQAPEGHPTVPQITHQLFGEGVKRIAVVTDEPDKYPADAGFAKGVSVHDRKDLDRVQRDLREVKGVSALIYDQVCATEKRRRRKRGTMADPDKRVFINEAVCEGCGDCGLTSNCLSVQPVETAFGRKRQIDQSSCNKDFTCVDGFCPSFVTVEGAAVRRPAETAIDPALFAALPDPDRPDLARPWSILIAGVGGTGVVTIAQLLGMAAHLEGKGVAVLDQIGLAQKYGGVTSNVRIAAEPGDLFASKIGVGGTDLLLGCDLVQAASADVIARLADDRSNAIVNSHETPTGDFTRQPDAPLFGDVLRARIEKACGPNHTRFDDVAAIGTALFGDSIVSNIMLLGLAYQMGVVPLSAEAIERAVALNGTAIDQNIAAFRTGRLLGHDAEKVTKLAEAARPALPHRHIPENLADLMALHQRHLTAYQNAAYAERYTALVEKVRAAEAKALPGHDDLAQTVAKSYLKLLAYKDEYEVARLYGDSAFARQLAQTFDGSMKLHVHLAPPLLARTDPATGRPEKRTFGPWILPVFGFLAKLKGLRGTAFDPFGYSAERKMERRLITDFEADVALILDHLDAGNHALASELAALPQAMRGFGPVKKANVEKAEQRRPALRDALIGGGVGRAEAAQ